MSKLLLWQVILERVDDPVFLLENDVRFAPNFSAEFAQSYAALPADWEVVHVGHCCGDDKPTTKINERVAEIRHPFCCHAVLWRRHALAQALAALRKASWGTPSDIILAKVVYPYLRHYSFVPPLVFQSGPISEAATTGRWDTIPGWFDFARIYDEQLRYVTTPKVFVEIGAWKGRSTAYMAEAIKRLMVPVKFFAVDTWLGMEYGGLANEVQRDYGGDLFPAFIRNMSRAGVYDYVTPLRMPSVEAATQFADRSVDFVFIDGDHTTEAVEADLTAWLPKLTPAGVIAGHDYDVDSVRRAVKRHLPRARQWERCWIAEANRRP